ncbi:TKL protein kinase [Phytophthora cinnamomi]|uniref:TKL protein kinase n=1 Tax=Phytophthora cinnamomi TaxID=4785 RepID=UPI0035598D82|nr:TKL protein kinase [Phytophthora cinnamomi]
MKASVAAALLLLVQDAGVKSVAGQSCALSASTLSTSCDDACSQYEPCLAYSASSCPAGATCVTADQCAIQCFSKPLDDTDTFTFLVEFGSYKSSKEQEKAGSSGSSAGGQVDETDTYVVASNDAVSNISTIELQPTVTSFVLAGGTNTNSSVKGKVARVTFGSDVISTQSNVSNVVLRNLDLSTDTTLQQLPIVLPTALQKLSLANTLLSAFPTLVANFTGLQTLDVAKNYITEIAATAALNSLVNLNFLKNELSIFRAVFPNLETLDLRNNNFTDIPQSIYIHDSLKELRMKGNPLASPWFTKAEADFLVQLTTLDLENSDFTKPIDTCYTANRLTVHSVIVCISDNGNDDGTDSSDEVNNTSSSSSTSNVFIIVGSIVGGLLVLGGVIFAGIWAYRRRVRRPQSRRSKTIRESYFGGVSPPLARSSADKGYRGGRRTPVSGGPRFCSSSYEEEEDSYSSPRISTRSTHSNNSSMAYSLWNDEELLSLQVKFEEIEDIGTIGSGAFGIIWLVKYRGNQLLASKRLRSDQVTKQRTQAFIEEIKMVAPFDHPNIVHLVGCAWTIETDLQALFEYMENGDLRDYLVDPNSPRHWSQELLQLAVDIIEALVYVHSFTPPLVHRDLKSRNVLLSGDMKAKVTDFGASRYKSVDETMTAAVGTGRWLAPEVISGSSKYDQSVDVFSFGVVLSEMDTHEIPYDDVRGANGNRLNDIAILQLVATDQLRPRFGAGCPPELRMLAERCLAQDPEERPPAHVVAYELRVIQRSHYTLL